MYILFSIVKKVSKDSVSIKNDVFDNTVAKIQEMLSFY